MRFSIKLCGILLILCCSAALFAACNNSSSTQPSTAPTPSVNVQPTVSTTPSTTPSVVPSTAPSVAPSIDWLSIFKVGNNAIIGLNQYGKTLTKLTIPESIMGMHITKIGNSAFSDATELAQIIIPETITEIGNSAFSNADALTEIFIPSSVTKIGNSAFYGCDSLQEVNFQEDTQLTEISQYAFAYCSALTDIEIPNSVTQIGEGVFYGCESLQKVRFQEDAQLTAISQRAFAYCPALTDIEIPNSVTSIRSYAFTNCISLEDIVIPSSVKYIKTDAFQSCSSLIIFCEASKMPDTWEGAWMDLYGDISVPLIWNYKNNQVARNGWIYFRDDGFMFALKGTEVRLVRCSHKKTGLVVIPATVTYNGKVYDVSEISTYAFRDSSLLSELIIPNSITRIEENAFSTCSITDIEIPASVTYFGNNAFTGCSSLVTVNYLGTVDQWADIFFANSYSSPMWKAEIFQINGVDTTEISLSPRSSINKYSFYGFSNLTKITLPQGITEIGEYAFSKCSALTEIVIPEGVTTIGDNAFDSCTQLTSVQLPQSLLQISNYAFAFCYSLPEITLPSNLSYIGGYAFRSTPVMNPVIPDSVARIDAGAFDCRTTIYCEAESKPSGWSSYWNPSNRPVVWGYTGE